MSAFTLSGKVYTTEDAVETVCLDELYPGRERPWFEGRVGSNCSIYRSKKGQWFQVNTRVLDHGGDQAQLISEVTAVSLMIEHNKKSEAVRIFGEAALEAMKG